MSRTESQENLTTGGAASYERNGHLGNSSEKNKFTNGKFNKRSQSYPEICDTENDFAVKKAPKYPWYIIFILGNEFCERFSYYGMKTVLTLYFSNVLLWSDNTSTIVYHLFSVLCYFTPILGAMLADGRLGKFRTIFSLSLVYVTGLILLTMSAVPPLHLHAAGTICGLILIGFGTGGIKPVVSAYGGDQFGPGDVTCYGGDCYALAFGLPAGLLVVAVVAFVAGRPFYNNVPSKENIIAKVFGCTFSALSNKIKKKGPVGAKHWMDNASDSYTPEFIEEVKQILPVLTMFLPVPVFWALFDQQGSRWTLQAKKMDGRLSDSFYWQPDQNQIFNPVLILLLIPFFEGVIFPLLNKCNISFKALARMTVGMLLAGMAFVIAAILQMQLEKTLPLPLAPQTAELRIYNTMPCPLNFTGSFNETALDSFSIPKYGEKVFCGFPVPDAFRDVQLTVFGTNCSSLTDTYFSKDFSINVTEGKIHSFILAYNVPQSDLVSEHLILDKKEKPKDGNAQGTFVLSFKFNTSSGDGDMKLINRNVAANKEGYSYDVSFNRSEESFFQTNYSVIGNVMKDISPGKYEVYYPDENFTNGLRRMGSTTLELANGGVYTVLLKNSDIDGQIPWERYAIVDANTLSLFWQLPQIFVMTVGEVLFSVSGLAFAYSQAPASMKSVLQAGWLMTVAFGNLIVIIISGAQITKDQATEFFVFAGLIGVFAIVFAVLAKFYRYVDDFPETNLIKVEDDDLD